MTFRLIQTENKGLSNARNLGMEAATGEIIAYIDDDAYPDPDWLKFLAAGFHGHRSRWDRWTEYCASREMGWSRMPWLTRRVARFMFSCQMKLPSISLAATWPSVWTGFARSEGLIRVSGLRETTSTSAGVCRSVAGLWDSAQPRWSGTIRRRSIRAYWKQQKGYAQAEALLAEKWPQKYNEAGHLNWSGRLYGKGGGQFFSESTTHLSRDVG